MIWIFGYLLAVAIGLSLGLIGGGGSILAVPVLVYVMGVTPKAAIAMSLAIVGTVSLIGAIPHCLQGNVNLKTAAIFTPAAMLGAYLGARLAAFPLITDTFQLVSFGIIMMLASSLMIWKGNRLEPNVGSPPVTGNREQLASLQDQQSKTLGTWSNPKPKMHPHQTRWFAIPLEGLGVGIITGFVGVGGGFAIIPALVLLGKIPMKEAIGTSLLIITFKSATGFLGYLSQVELDWYLMITFTIAASTGTITGAILTRFIEAKQLQKGFGYFVLAVAIYVLIRR